MTEGFNSKTVFKIFLCLSFHGILSNGAQIRADGAKILNCNTLNGIIRSKGFLDYSGEVDTRSTTV